MRYFVVLNPVVSVSVINLGRGLIEWFDFVYDGIHIEMCRYEKSMGFSLGFCVISLYHVFLIYFCFV